MLPGLPRIVTDKQAGWLNPSVEPPAAWPEAPDCLDGLLSRLVGRGFLGLHRWPIFVTERIMEEVGHGAVLQALRKRGAGQERADARQAALLVQGLRPELHRYPRTRQAAGPEGCCRAALCQWPIDEPHGQAAWRVDAHRPGLAGAVRASVRAEA